MDGLRTEYTNLAFARRDLELAYANALYKLADLCAPMKKAYGVHLPCHESFREAIKLYRSLQQKPECVVGASLPLRPAEVSPFWAVVAAVRATSPTEDRCRCGAASFLRHK